MILNIYGITLPEKIKYMFLKSTHNIKYNKETLKNISNYDIINFIKSELKGKKWTKFIYQNQNIVNLFNATKYYGWTSINQNLQFKLQEIQF